MGLVKIILDAISPQLRDLIIQFVRSLTAQAAKTPNPWDDIFVSILKVILDIKD